jgi:hypothetical protein
MTTSIGRTMPSSFVATRAALHVVAEHVLAPARYAASGHIGLAVQDGGFWTPSFGSGPTVIGVVGNELTVRVATQERRTRLTTLREAAAFAGTPLGAPANVYRPATPCDPDGPLAIDRAEAQEILSWYERVDTALRWLAASDGGDPVEPTVWPEHLDVAIRLGDINIGGLAGDETVPDPYAYVGAPASVISGDSFFNFSFGAARTWRETPTEDQIGAFFQDGLTRARTVARRPS